MGLTPGKVSDGFALLPFFLPIGRKGPGLSSLKIFVARTGIIWSSILRSGTKTVLIRFRSIDLEKTNKWRTNRYLIQKKTYLNFTKNPK